MEHVQIRLPYAFNATVIPKGYRYPRCQVFRSEKLVPIRSVTAAEAPVAFRWKGDRDDGISNVVRFYGNKLWTRHFFHAHRKTPRHVEAEQLINDVLRGSDYANPLLVTVGCPASTLSEYYRTKSATPPSAQFTVEKLGEISEDDRFREVVSSDEDQALAQIRQKAKDVLLIDGMVWVAENEPVYMVQTFGLGNNHGGTGLFVECRAQTDKLAKNVFRADQFEEAVTYAEKIARARGDTNSLPMECHHGRIEVCISEAIKLKAYVPPKTRRAPSNDGPGM